MLRPSRFTKLLAALCLGAITFSTFAVNLGELRRQDLTPPKFASFFRDFKFDYRKEIQPPESFLARKAGDCDDYSTLAAAVLREKGYTPRLISIRMQGVTHVVCYIEETRSYLDYNFRGHTVAVNSGDILREIAGTVARSYGRNWSSVSEFTYHDRVKRLVQTVIEPQAQKSFASVFR